LVKHLRRGLGVSRRAASDSNVYGEFGSRGTRVSLERCDKTERYAYKFCIEDRPGKRCRAKPTDCGHEFHCSELHEEEGKALDKEAKAREEKAKELEEKAKELEEKAKHLCGDLDGLMPTLRANSAAEIGKGVKNIVSVLTGASAEVLKRPNVQDAKSRLANALTNSVCRLMTNAPLTNRQERLREVGDLVKSQDFEAVVGTNLKLVQDLLKSETNRFVLRVVNSSGENGTIRTGAVQTDIDNGVSALLDIEATGGTVELRCGSRIGRRRRASGRSLLSREEAMR